MREQLKLACAAFEAAEVKPSINKLAQQYDLHPQILTGALMAYEAIPDPKKRGPRGSKFAKPVVEVPEGPAHAPGQE